MFGTSKETGFEYKSTIELDEFIRENRSSADPTFRFQPRLGHHESQYEKAVREKSKRTENSEFAAKEQSKVNVKILQDQQGVLQGILSELALPWYKTANGWFSFIAMTAAIVGIILAFI